MNLHVLLLNIVGEITASVWTLSIDAPHVHIGNNITLLIELLEIINRSPVSRKNNTPKYSRSQKIQRTPITHIIIINRILYFPTI